MDSASSNFWLKALLLALGAVGLALLAIESTLVFQFCAGIADEYVFGFGGALLPIFALSFCSLALRAWRIERRIIAALFASFCFLYAVACVPAVMGQLYAIELKAVDARSKAEERAKFEDIQRHAEDGKVALEAQLDRLRRAARVASTSADVFKLYDQMIAAIETEYSKPLTFTHVPKRPMPLTKILGDQGAQRFYLLYAICIVFGPFGSFFLVIQLWPKRTTKHSVHWDRSTSSIARASSKLPRPKSQVTIVAGRIVPGPQELTAQMRVPGGKPASSSVDGIGNRLRLALDRLKFISVIRGVLQRIQQLGSDLPRSPIARSAVQVFRCRSPPLYGPPSQHRS